ncbi:hypothetical protein AA0313_2499 [Acetobacter indonesiensis NRIC 0313]|uniref:Uncharacterized protein n=1 Tax=Acetobacter indonesiensis TaxID=104101 RepID=A0A6N3SYZ5_9PROT|nr:hypothetical protein Abin_006_149 [Acetobacter indonesiensis]GBQ60718.1 hypothetical protein AA0313_2499 [Acetobacter indonesiensis NRIC 0313]GEN02126.1 hypothetical protein AIN02nite_01510 [Acetobacter indonesiensis]
MLMEGARLFQQFINESGLAMIDVSNDGDIADIHERGLMFPARSAATVQRNGAVALRYKECWPR